MSLPLTRQRCSIHPDREAAARCPVVRAVLLPRMRHRARRTPALRGLPAGVVRRRPAPCPRAAFLAPAVARHCPRRRARVQPVRFLVLFRSAGPQARCPARRVSPRHPLESRCRHAGRRRLKPCRTRRRSNRAAARPAAAFPPRFRCSTNPSTACGSRPRARWPFITPERSRSRWPCSTSGPTRATAPTPTPTVPAPRWASPCSSR